MLEDFETDAIGAQPISPDYAFTGSLCTVQDGNRADSAKELRFGGTAGSSCSFAVPSMNWCNNPELAFYFRKDIIATDHEISLLIQGGSSGKQITGVYFGFGTTLTAVHVLAVDRVGGGQAVSNGFTPAATVWYQALLTQNCNTNTSCIEIVGQVAPVCITRSDGISWINGASDEGSNNIVIRSSKSTTFWIDDLDTDPRQLGWPEAPLAPENLQVGVGPNPTDLELTWDPPADPGSTAITKYKIYRGTALGSQTFLANVTNGLIYTDAGVGYSETRYYRVSAENAYGEGASSSIVAETTPQPGRMNLADAPKCSTESEAPQFDIMYCNSERFGFTDTIDASNLSAPEFTVNWGDFNGHEHIDCGEQACTFWLEFDLGVDSPSASYTSYDGETVPVAQLRRWTGTTWIDVPDGLVTAEIDAPSGQPWTLLMPGRLLLTHEALATSQGSAAFRLVALDRPEGGGVWELDLDAAMGQLAAPPVLLVHGWDRDPGKEPDKYVDVAGWGLSMESRLISRARFVHGQNPWQWSEDGAIRNPRFDAKADFRLSAFDLYRNILLLKEDPAATGDALSYAGPVNIITHSLGGLASRSLVEQALPSLATLNGGTIDPGDGRSLTAAETKLNEWSSPGVAAPHEIVSSIVMLGTPNLGSKEATLNVFVLHAGLRRDCLVAFFTFDQCEAYYVAKDDSDLIDTGLKSQPWWRDEVGAYRNRDHPAGYWSMMADLELLHLDDGNPVLENLDEVYGAPGVRYFHAAGHYLGTGDLIVSAESATHGGDDSACWRVYENEEVDYWPGGTGTAHHNDLPTDRKVQDDALAFLAGEKTSVCDNQPEYGNAAQSQAFVTDEPNGLPSSQFSVAAGIDCGVLQPGLGPALGSEERLDESHPRIMGNGVIPIDTGVELVVIGAPPNASPEVSSRVVNTVLRGEQRHVVLLPDEMPLVAVAGEAAACRNEEEGDQQRGDGLPESGHASASADSSHQSVEFMAQAGSLYEAPVAFNVSITGSVYSTRLEWDAPGESNGTLALLGFNGTLSSATLDLHSPSGAVASLAGGNISWANWTGPRVLDEHHLITVHMPDAAQGTWTLWVNRTSPWPGFVYPSVTFETEFGIDTTTDDHGVIGAPLTYRIQPTNAGNPVLDAVVLLDVYDPAQGASHPLVLLDDGLNGDEAAGDGTYSAQHTFLANGSFPYHATATFTGTTLHVEGATPILDEEEVPPAWPPSKPLNVTATRGPGGSEITLNWLPSISNGGSPVTGYDVYRANETGVHVFYAATGNVTTYTDSDLGANATHTYTVAARNAVGYSRLSNQANATTFRLASASRNLAATPSAAGEIALQWEAPLDDGGSPVTNYTVYSGDAPDSLVALATVGNVLAYTETDLDANVTRFYKITAVTLAGPGVFSDHAQATTITVAPTAPRNLTVTAGPSAGGLTLAWQAPSDDGGDAVTGYAVYRGNGTAWNLLTSVGNVHGYVDSALGNNATWHYRLAAANAAGEGTHSGPANATTFDVPRAPQNVSASVGPGAGQITLTWQSPARDGGTPVTNYTVYAGNASGALVQLAVLGPVSSFRESGLPNDATRYYAVTATNLAGEGRQSNEAAAGTFDVPLQPLNLTATSGIGNVTLAWQAPEGNGGTPVTGYRVYRGNATVDLESYASVGNVLTYLDGNATPGTRYLYAVSALNIAGEGLTSGEAPARPSALLLSLPVVALPEEGESVVTIVVCDSGSDMGCTGSVLIESPKPDDLGGGLGNPPGDPDGDGFPTESEAAAGSNPFQANSTPNTDDDGDTSINRLESPAAATYQKAYCTGAYGIVGFAGCGHYTQPQGFSSIGGEGFAWRDDSGNIWVWDPVCLPGIQGDYQTCKTTGNRGLSTAGYHGNWTDDGYGWRRLDTSPGITAQTYGLCTDGIHDPDLDGIPTFHLCTSTLTVDSNGAVEQGEPQPWQAVGDQIPTTAFLCIELQIATAAAKLACIDHALIAPDIDAALHALSPIEVDVPVGVNASTPEIQVTYLHEASLLNSVLVACAPVHPTLDDAMWLLGNGGEASLTVTLKHDQRPNEAVTAPWLGQLVAASQATLGGIPCG